MAPSSTLVSVFSAAILAASSLFHRRWNCWNEETPEGTAGRLNAIDCVAIDRDRARREALGLTDKSRRAAGRRAEYLMSKGKIISKCDR